MSTEKPRVRSEVPSLRERLDDGGIVAVVQGGGMRGTYSIAALAALEDVGLTAGISSMWASSAGALNSAYFLAGQANAAVSVYVEHLSNRRFVNPYRLWRIMDIDHLIDDVLTNDVPLDVGSILAASAELFVVLTNAATGEVEVVEAHDQDVDLMEALRASAALPVIFGREVELNGQKFVDGGLRASVPLDLCLQEDTDYLVILTRPVSHRRVLPPRVLRSMTRGLGRVWRHSPGVIDWLGKKDFQYNKNMEQLTGQASVPSGTRIWVVEPSDLSRLAERTTGVKEQLLDTAMLAKSDMRTILDQPPAVVG